MLDLNKMLRMDGKTVLVTGGASGIGLEVARFLSAVGASVAVVDLDEKNGKMKAEDIQEQGGQARFYRCDVTDATAVECTVNSVIQDLKKIDCLVNCAGVIMRADVLTLEEKD